MPDANSLALIFSAITGLSALGGSIYITRRYQRLGGGEAQERFNDISKELSLALEKKVAILSSDLLTKTSEATSLRARIRELQAELDTERRQRLSSQQDIDDLREQIRTLRREAVEDREEMRANGHNGESE